MTKEAVAELIRLNFILYKLGAKPLTDEEVKAMIDVWTYQFKDYDDKAVKVAFLAANRVCKYPIGVADVFEQLSKSIDPAVEWETLERVAKKAQKYLGWRKYPMLVGVTDDGKPIRSDGRAEMQELFCSLPAAAKNYVGSPNGLVELAQTSDLTYRRAEFLKQARAEITTSPRKAERLRSADLKKLEE